MYIVAIAWIYVVVLMALAEALSTQGSVLGAFFTFVLYGVLPLSIVLYVMDAPRRRRARRAADNAATDLSAVTPDSGSEPPGDAVATERKET